MATFNFEKTIERDIDRIICEELYCSQDFFNIFLNKIGVKDGEIISIEHSKFEDTIDENGIKSRGESDVEVVYKSNGTLHGLLIEDKISAAPQPRQAERYRERGEKYVAEGRIVDYQTCIVAPEKYIDNKTNKATEYDIQISFDEIIYYFKKRKGTNNEFKRNCFEVPKVKQQYSSRQLRCEHPKGDFVIGYVEFLERYLEKPNNVNVFLTEVKIPEGEKKPKWFRYKCSIRKSYIHHKIFNIETRKGYVDIILTGRTEDQLEHINEIIRPYVQNVEGLEDVVACIPKDKQVVIRKTVAPVFNFVELKGQENNLKKALDAVVRMYELSEKLKSTDI